MLPRLRITYRVQPVLDHTIHSASNYLHITRRLFQTSVSPLSANPNVGNPVSENVRMLMRRVTQPVVLVTTEGDTPNGRVQRGLTVSSFTTICLTPSPFICFSTRQTSRAADLIASRGTFIVHLLSCTPDSAKIAEAFSKSDLAPRPTANIQNPFELGKWRRNDKWKLPILDGVLGALLCKLDKAMNVGDHKLWIAEVKDVMVERSNRWALGYCDRKYRKEGEPIWPHDTSEEEGRNKA